MQRRETGRTERAILSAVRGTIVVWLCVGVAACDDAAVGECSGGGQLVEAADRSYCAFAPAVVTSAGSSFRCPSAFPVHLDVSGGVVCADRPTELDELPTRVCEAIGVACGRALDAGTDAAPPALDAASRDAATPGLDADADATSDAEPAPPSDAGTGDTDAPRSDAGDADAPRSDAGPLGCLGLPDLLAGYSPVRQASDGAMSPYTLGTLVRPVEADDQVMYRLSGAVPDGMLSLCVDYELRSDSPVSVGTQIQRDHAPWEVREGDYQRVAAPGRHVECATLPAIDPADRLSPTQVVALRLWEPADGYAVHRVVLCEL